MYGPIFCRNVFYLGGVIKVVDTILLKLQNAWIENKTEFYLRLIKAVNDESTTDHLHTVALKLWSIDMW